MSEQEKELFGVETDFIRIRQERINEIVAAVHAGLDVGNIDLTYIEKLAEARTQQADFFALLDELKEDTMNEQEKEAILAEFDKWLNNEEEKQA